MKTTTLSLILIPLVILSIGGSVGVKADDGAISASDEALQNSNGIKNVFMVYLCGDNNLAGSAESDIQEMIAAGGSDNILAIIVLWDKPGSAEDGIYDITASGPVRVWASPGEINTADPATLSFFLSYVGTTFTADRYILDIWAHGNGFQGAQGVCCDNNAYNRLSIQGVCYDDNPGSYMSIPALESALATGDVHCDLIVFDACLMDMIEVAYEIRNNGEVMVASEENVPLAGYPYTPILTWLRMNPAVPDSEVGSIMASEYNAAYLPDTDVTLAVIDLTQSPSLAMALDNLSDVLLSNMGIYKTDIMTAVSATERYPWDRWDREYGDIVDFTTKLDAEVSDPAVHTATAAVRAAVTSAVIAEAHHGSHTGGAHGVSVWLGEDHYDGEYDLLQFAEDTSWDECMLELVTTPTTISTLTADPASSYIGKDLRLSGIITPDVSQNGAVIDYVNLQVFDGSQWVSTGISQWIRLGGSFTFTITGNEAGVSTYRVHYPGSGDVMHPFAPSDSPPIDVVVQKIPTGLSVPVPSTPIPLINVPFSLAGRLAAEGTGLTGKTVQLWSSRDNGTTWVDTGVTAVTSSLTGKYTFSVTEVTGGYRMYRVSFAGDTQYAAIESTSGAIRMNSPPNTSSGYASQTCVAANSKHTFVPISVRGVTDPEGDPVTIKIAGITSDEVTATDKQSGGAKYAPDAGISGNNNAIVRAERSSAGNGRVYTILFTASDDINGVSQGVVTVCVPLKYTTPCTCIDSGQLYDATKIN